VTLLMVIPGIYLHSLHCQFAIRKKEGHPACKTRSSADADKPVRRV